MDFDLTPRQKALQQRTRSFIAEKVIPLENDPRHTAHGPSAELRAELACASLRQGVMGEVAHVLRSADDDRQPTPRTAGLRAVEHELTIGPPRRIALQRHHRTREPQRGFGQQVDGRDRLVSQGVELRERRGQAVIDKRREQFARDPGRSCDHHRLERRQMRIDRPTPAGARDPILMASAMKKAVEAGREAFLAGRMAKKLYSAAPSSPTESGAS